MGGNRIDYAAELNAEQQAAVTAPDGPVLVIAAAGTGKTRTLVYRVAYLVEGGHDPNSILLLTFTNRAAHEMLERARGLVGGAVSGLWGGTFHHMANRLLRRHAAAVGYQSDYTILDSDDARRLVRHCSQELKLTDKHFPKPDVLLGLYGLAASTERPVVALAEERFAYSKVEPDDIVAVHDAYEKRKRRLNAMDFDDLLTNGLRLLTDNPDLCERYRQQFGHILVDEYQDTNTVQAHWVDLLTGPGGNVLVVGDDFQSIYSWRGADYRNIISFPERYPNAHVYYLVTNYRSVPEILQMANACIAGNPKQFQKTLQAVRDPYERPNYVELHDGHDQANFIIEEARRLRMEGYRYSEMVVLYRAHYHAMELQMALSRDQSVPYVITSGIRFFEQGHIKDVCALLRLLANPGDELAFQRLCCLWKRLGPKTALRIWNGLGGRCDLRKDATRERVAKGLPAPAREGWNTVEMIAADFDRDELAKDPGEIIHRFLAGFYEDYARETFENADRRLEDLNELMRYTTNFPTLDAFLSEMALQTNLDAEAEIAAQQQDDVLRLSTIHQAKGLEWKVVFLCWVADGMFPAMRAVNESEEGLAEERRLFYVALTRAKDALYLCVPRQRRARDGSPQYLTPSTFLQELAPDLMSRRRG